MRKPNYEMTFSVSQVANLFETDREIIKKWAYLFQDYLQVKSNPGKGIKREFCEKDLRVFAYIYMHWENEPDIENIKYGLNSKDYFDDIYNNFITLAKPTFINLPEDINEEWKHGAMICAIDNDTFNIALSYKNAGDYLVEIAISKDNVLELICPIIFTYRHATELYLKAISPIRKRNHDLSSLLPKFKELLKVEYNTDLPIWFEDIILVFSQFDPKGTNFRYGSNLMDEVWVDIIHLKKKMNWLAKTFKNIKIHRRTV